MRYLPKSESERAEMLEACGLESLEGLFSQLPAESKLDRPLNIPAGKSEYEIVDYFKRQAARNADGFVSLLGAGVYYHYRPVLVDTVVSRGEFLTAYTPYQAEISQGVLTTIFEFQSMICQLTGMDVANASMYDGSTAVPEAAMMAVRITKRDKVLAARTLHPEYRAVLDTYCRHQHIPIETIAYNQETGLLDLEAVREALDDNTAAVIVQSPNFFGCVEHGAFEELAEMVHKAGALLVVVFTEAVSLGLLRPPMEADIVAGELQSFAISPSYGGPFVGVIAAKQKYLRQMPGRLVGQTNDSNGNRAFCLTLSTREQHIRREKATSNICTNQALIALMATVFMTVYGKVGLRELAEQNLAKAHYLAQRLPRRFSGPIFNEFVATAPSEAITRKLADKKILAGVPIRRFYPEVEDGLLLCATEMTPKASMDQVVEAFAQ